MPAGCPACGEEKKPSNVAPVYDRLPAPGRDRAGRGLARFAAQLPIEPGRLVTLGEGGTPLIAVDGLGEEIGFPRLLLKDERRNPTGSWRDRYAAVAVSRIESAGATVAVAGDEALCLAVASYAARAGIRSVSMLAPDASGRTQDGIEAVGGRSVAVDGHEQRLGLLADAERSLGWVAASNRAMPPIGGDPLAAEGYKTIAYEIVEDLGGDAPDFVAVPASLGDGIAGIWRGFRDLVGWRSIRAMPRLIAVEVSGSVASALAAGSDWVQPSGDVKTPARALRGVTGTTQTLRAVNDSEGLVVRCSSAELEEARIQLGEAEGIWADLAAAAPIAAYTKLASRESIPADSAVVAVVTEHGALDESAVAAESPTMIEPRVDELLRVLAVRGVV